jgi:hypothetical protein
MAQHSETYQNLQASVIESPKLETTASKTVTLHQIKYSFITQVR